MALLLFFNNRRSATRNINVSEVLTVRDRIYWPSSGSPLQLYINRADLISVQDVLSSLRSRFQSLTRGGIQWLVSINNFGRFTDGDTLIASPRPDSPSHYDNGIYLKKLTDSFSITRSWADPHFGIDTLDSLSFGVENTDAALLSWLSTDVRGAEVRLYRYFQDFDFSVLEFVGVVDSIEYSDIVELGVAAKDPDLLSTVLPNPSGLTIAGPPFFPRAYIDDQGSTIALVLGYAGIIPARYINYYPDPTAEDPETAIPASFKFASTDEIPVAHYAQAIGNVGIPQLYRDGEKIDPEEYRTSISVYPGFTAIRFLTDQTSSQGSLFTITGDICGIYGDPGRGFYRSIIDEVKYLEPDNYKLLAYWRFGNSSGDIIEEVNNYQGTIVGTVTRGARGGIPGDNNKAFHYSGNGHVDLDDPGGIFNFTGAFTAEFLFRRTPTAESPAVQTYEALVSKYDGTDGWYISLKPGTGQIRALVSDGGTAADTGDLGTSLADGLWHHVIMTYSGTGIIDLYVDGEDLGNDTAAITAVGSTATHLLVGKNVADEGMVDGEIDELVLRIERLSPTSVTLRYKSLKGFVCQYKFDRSLYDDVGGFDFTGTPVVTETGNDAYYLRYFTTGYMPYGQSALIQRTWDYNNGFNLYLDYVRQATTSGNVLLCWPHISIRWVVKLSPETNADVIGPCVMLGPRSTLSADGTTVTKGWGVFRTSAHTYAWKVQTIGLGTQTLSMGTLSSEQWSDITLVSLEDRYYVYVNGILKNSLPSSAGKIVYDVTHYGGLQVGIIFESGINRGFGFKGYHDYLAIKALTDVSADLAEIRNDYWLHQRNGVEIVRRVMNNSVWGLSQGVDIGSDFNNNRDQWSKIPIRANVALTEPVAAQDVLDSVLSLRGARIYRISGSDWAIEVLSPGDLGDVTPIGHGHDLYNNMVEESPRISFRNTDEAVKDLEVAYRPQRDPTSGSFIDYAFRSSAQASAKGRTLGFPAPALYDHADAFYFTQYFKKQIAAADKRLYGVLDELSGRYLRPGSIVQVYIPRYGITGEYYRIQKLVTYTHKHEFEAIQYDATTFDVPEISTLPIDNAGPERLTRPDIGDWTIYGIPQTLSDGELFAVRLIFAQKYTIVPDATVASALSFTGASTEEAAVAENSSSSYVYITNPTKVANSTYSLTTLTLRLKGGVIVAVQHQATYSYSVTDGATAGILLGARLGNTGAYLFSPAILAQGIDANNDGTLDTFVVTGLTYEFWMEKDPDGGSWAIADISNLQYYVALSLNGSGQVQASYLRSNIYIQDYNKLPKDLNLILLFRNTTGVAPNPQLDAPFRVLGATLSFDDFDELFTGTTYYYWIAFRDTSGLISDLSPVFTFSP